MLIASVFKITNTIALCLWVRRIAMLLLQQASCKMGGVRLHLYTFGLSVITLFGLIQILGAGESTQDSSTAEFNGLYINYSINHLGYCKGLDRLYQDSTAIDTWVSHNRVLYY